MNLHVKRLGRVEYEPTWQAMQDFTASRTPDTADEIWIVEHDPVFTLGLAADPQHLLNPIGIPLVQTDRGGEITSFDDFDIDYNQQKYLMETRMSGALTKPKSAIVIEQGPKA